MAEALMTASCVHYWVLGAPGDEVIEGRCKLCGASREYPASVELATKAAADREAASIVHTVKLLPDFEPDTAMPVAVA
jgi:hypothetical protein